VEARIIKGFSIPKELINSDKSSGLSNGGEKKQAITEFNDNTSPDRLELSETFAEIFSHFYSDINPTANWSILPIPANIADDITGIKAGTSINQLLLADIPQENKIATLIYAYGFKTAEAEAMCSSG